MDSIKARPTAQEGESLEATGLSQLKDARARVRLGDNGAAEAAVAQSAETAAARRERVEPPPASEARAGETAAPAASPDRDSQAGEVREEETGEAKPLASRLLDARRKRRD